MAKPRRPTTARRVTDDKPSAASRQAAFDALPEARARNAPPRVAVPLQRNCGTMGHHLRQLELVPGLRQRLLQLESATAKRRMAPMALAQLPVVTIDVMVHILFNTPDQQVSDAQIESQLAVLNADYRRTNADVGKVPPPFAGAVADPRITFKLKGVTRTRTAVTAFYDDDEMKRVSGGGIAPIDPRTVLNTWVCPLADGLLGYAQFPGAPPATDGVVINYQAFGTTGTAVAPFNLGRTMTHEVGHYLNLRHIWGDTPDCSGSDMVADTPNAEGPNYGTPTFPSVSCGNGPHGDMFMNYMDYVDDAAMFMFTAQQVVRMRATLDGPRKTLV